MTTINGYAIETYDTIILYEKAPLIIDGDLEDWNILKLKDIPILNPIISKNYLPPQSPYDLSASFSCFADPDNIYVSIKVVDNKICIGNHEYGLGWNDDSIEINYDGDLKDTSKHNYDSNDGLIRVTSDKNGVTLIEGSYGIIPPYIWEARGVRAGFKKYDSGYQIEVMIPIRILEWSDIYLNKRMGMNIRVFDSDNDKGASDHGLSWSIDSQNISFFSTKYYNNIVFTENIKIPDTNKSAQNINDAIILTNQRNIILELGSPNNIIYNDNLVNILKYINEKKWDAAEAELNNIKDRVWAQPIFSIILFQNKKLRNSMSLLSVMIDNSPDMKVRSWAESQGILNMKNIERTLEGENYNDCIKIYEEFIPHIKNDSHIMDAKILLARLYFKISNYERAKIICDEVMQSNVNNSIKYEADMLLRSISLKNNN